MTTHFSTSVGKYLLKESLLHMKITYRTEREESPKDNPDARFLEDVAGSLAYARCPATCPLPINEKQPALNRSVGVHRQILGPEKVIQTKLFQSNNHLTAQSCRKEVDRGPKSPRCGSSLAIQRAHLLWRPRRPVCSPHVDSCFLRGRLGRAGVSRDGTRVQWVE